MGGNKNNGVDVFLQVLFGIFAVVAIKSLFEHDNSKILSKKGSEMLSDNEKMKELDKKLREMDSNKESEIII